MHESVSKKTYDFRFAANPILILFKAHFKLADICVFHYLKQPFIFSVG